MALNNASTTIKPQQETEAKRNLHREKTSEGLLTKLGSGARRQDPEDSGPKESTRTEQRIQQQMRGNKLNYRNPAIGGDTKQPSEATPAGSMTRADDPQRAGRAGTIKKTDKTGKGIKQKWNKLKAAQSKLKKPSEITVEGGGAKQNFTIFMLTLSLAAVKDLIDFVSLGIIGTLINVVVTLAFMAILLFQGSSMKKMKKRWIRYGIAAVAEFIPVISILPFWSGSVIWDRISKK